MRRSRLLWVAMARCQAFLLSSWPAQRCSDRLESKLNSARRLVSSAQLSSRTISGHTHLGARCLLWTIVDYP